MNVNGNDVNVTASESDNTVTYHFIEQGVEAWIVQDFDTVSKSEFFFKIFNLATC